MNSFLWTSLIGSVVLTVLLNVVPRLFPRQVRKVEQPLHDWLAEAEDVRDPQTSKRRVEVYFPWKAMLIASVVLTILVNVVGYLFG